MIDDIILKNSVTGVQIAINMSRGPYWLQSLTVDPLKGKAHTYKYLDQVGEYLDNVTLETRDVSLVAWAVDTPELSISQAKKTLNSMINPKQMLEIIHEGYKLEFYPDSSIQYSPKEAENNEVMAKFMIQGLSVSPLWGLQSPVETPVAYTVYGWVLPFVIPEGGLIFGVEQPTVSTQIDNQGDLAIGCTISIEATGSVVNPRIECAETQEVFALNKTLAAGESVIIDTRLGSRSVTGIIGGSEENYMPYMTYDSQWITLALGVNTLSFSADSGANFLSVKVGYSPAYFEVDD